MSDQEKGMAAAGRWGERRKNELMLQNDRIACSEDDSITASRRGISLKGECLLRSDTDNFAAPAAFRRIQKRKLRGRKM